MNWEHLHTKVADIRGIEVRKIWRSNQYFWIHPKFEVIEKFDSMQDAVKAACDYVESEMW